MLVTYYKNLRGYMATINGSLMACCSDRDTTIRIALERLIVLKSGKDLPYTPLCMCERDTICPRHSYKEGITACICGKELDKNRRCRLLHIV